MANDDQKDYETRPVGFAKWRKRWLVALDDFARSGLPFVPQPSTIIIKGDSALVLQKSIYIKGDVAFAFESEYFKGDTSLIGVRQTLIKGDVEFVTFAVYVKGSVSLAVNVPLDNLGPDPVATKPGAISRFWLSVSAVKKDVT